MDKRFIFEDHCSFDAENIDDACLKLSEHFRKLSQDENYEEHFLETGEMKLHRDDE